MLGLLNRMEQAIILFIQGNLSNSSLDWFFPFYTDIHKDSWFIISCILPFVALWTYRLGKARLPILFGFFLTLIFTDGICGQIIKKTFTRSRPFQESQLIMALSPASGFSFVSNHSANGFAMATYLSHFYPRFSVLFWILASITAFSRIYNGVHYPSDVIIGAFIGVGIAKFIIRIIESKFKLAGKI